MPWNGHPERVQPLLEVSLDGGPDAPRRARKALLPLEKQLGALCHDVLLLVSELVTNAVVHANADPILLSVTARQRDDIRVAVTASGPLWEPPVEPRPGPLGGFGFFFVDQLANDWGVTSKEGESQVWFEVAPHAALR
jgi:anti-sigma regulatory factor (Ser/Thr protein kinase)